MECCIPESDLPTSDRAPLRAGAHRLLLTGPIRVGDTNTRQPCGNLGCGAVALHAGSWPERPAKHLGRALLIADGSRMRGSAASCTSSRCSLRRVISLGFKADQNGSAAKIATSLDDHHIYLGGAGMTVQELIDWREGAKDPDGVEGVDPNAPVKIALMPEGRTSLSVPTMAGGVTGRCTHRDPPEPKSLD
jgi:hypothetical protein